jgi:hypothetical protein
MSDVRVYSARPERVLAAAALLQRHGVSSRVAKAPAIAFPWILAAVPSQELFVDETDVARARKLLDAFEADRVVAARKIVRSLRWPVLAMALSFVGLTAFLITREASNGTSALGGLACLVVLIASFRKLRKKPAVDEAPHGGD